MCFDWSTLSLGGRGSAEGRGEGEGVASRGRGLPIDDSLPLTPHPSPAEGEGRKTRDESHVVVSTSADRRAAVAGSWGEPHVWHGGSQDAGALRQRPRSDAGRTRDHERTVGVGEDNAVDP